MSKDGQGLHWFCQICESTTLGLIKVVSHLDDRVKKLEESIEKKAHKKEVDRKIQDIEARLIGSSNQDEL